MAKAVMLKIIAIAFFATILGSVNALDMCFGDMFTCERKAESVCNIFCAEDCECACIKECFAVEEGACEEGCGSKGCITCYRVGECRCNGQEAFSVFPFVACEQRERCYNREVCIGENCFERSDLWNYDSCSGWLYETQNCAELGETGECGEWKCSSVGRHRTYKSRFRTDIEGYCSEGQCETRVVTAECERTVCPNGCTEVDGVGKCYPKAIIKTVPAVEGYNIEITEGDRVVFDCSDSYDPDGADVSCRWSFGYGGATATGTVVTHTFNRSGSYRVRLTVADGSGLTDSAEIIVNVVHTNWPPNACFTVNQETGIVGKTVFEFDASCSSDPDADFGDYISSYEWQFGDGRRASGEKVTHTYETKPLDGEVEYEVKLVVQDRGYGGRASLSSMEKKTITVKNNKPSAEFSAEPQRGKPPLEVKFKAVGEDPDGHKVTYAWEFGDGSVAIGREATNTYNEIGEYRVVLTATDEYGAKNSQEKRIRVYELEGITMLGVEDIVQKETAVVFADCVGGDIVNLSIGLDEGSLTKFTGVSCGTHINYGPVNDLGKYTVIAEMPDCNATECIKTASFKVVEKPADEVVVYYPEMHYLIVLVTGLIAMGFATLRSKR